MLRGRFHALGGILQHLHGKEWKRNNNVLYCIQMHQYHFCVWGTSQNTSLSLQHCSLLLVFPGTLTPIWWHFVKPYSVLFRWQFEHLSCRYKLFIYINIFKSRLVGCINMIISESAAFSSSFFGLPIQFSRWRFVLWCVYFLSILWNVVFSPPGCMSACYIRFIMLLWRPCFWSQDICRSVFIADIFWGSPQKNLQFPPPNGC